MGEQADYVNDSFLDDTPEETEGPLQTTCKYCGHSEVYWVQDWETFKWFLAAGDGYAHKCRRSKAN